MFNGQFFFNGFFEPEQKNMMTKNSDERNMKKNSYIYDSPISKESQMDLEKKKRGPYKKYETRLKEDAIFRVKEKGQDAKEVAKILKVPLKNVKRWINVGAYRKKGKNYFFYHFILFFFKYLLNFLHIKKKKKL